MRKDPSDINKVYCHPSVPNNPELTMSLFFPSISSVSCSPVSLLVSVKKKHNQNIKNSHFESSITHVLHISRVSSEDVDRRSGG